MIQGFTVKGSIGAVQFFEGRSNKVYWTGFKEPQIFQNENLAKRVCIIANKRFPVMGPFKVKAISSC